MKKIISTSLLISTLVYGDLVKVIPLDKTFLSSENGGSQMDIQMVLVL